MIDAKTKFVSVFIFSIKPDDLSAFARNGALVLQRRGATLPGFVEGIIMTNEEKTQVLIITQWDSRNSWSAARWDEDMERSLSDLVETAQSFDVRSYEPITVVRGY